MCNSSIEKLLHQVDKRLLVAHIFILLFWLYNAQEETQNYSEYPLTIAMLIFIIQVSIAKVLLDCDRVVLKIFIMKLKCEQTKLETGNTRVSFCIAYIYCMKIQMKHPTWWICKRGKKANFFCISPTGFYFLFAYFDNMDIQFGQYRQHHAQYYIYYQISHKMFLLFNTSAYQRNDELTVR